MAALELLPAAAGAPLVAARLAAGGLADAVLQAGVLHRAVREGWPQVEAKLRLPARVHTEVSCYADFFSGSPSRC